METIHVENGSGFQFNDKIQIDTYDDKGNLRPVNLLIRGTKGNLILAMKYNWINKMIMKSGFKYGTIVGKYSQVKSILKDAYDRARRIL